MPFLITEENKELVNKFTDVEHVKCEEFLDWREKTNKRSDEIGRISEVQIDFLSDSAYVDFRKNDIKKLLPKKPTNDEYLGILFTSEFQQNENNYSKLAVVLCLANGPSYQKKTIMDSSGNSIKVGDYNGLNESYENRVRHIRRKSNNQYYDKYEMSGIYHKAIDVLECIGKLGADNLRFSFIMDLQKTTVIISDDKFIIEDYECNIKLDAPVLYDHGTGCCTII